MGLQSSACSRIGGTNPGAEADLSQSENISASDINVEQQSGDLAKSPEANELDIAPVASVVTDTQELLAAGEGMPGLRVEQGEGFSRVVIDAGETPSDVQLLALQGPERLVVDIIGNSARHNAALGVESGPIH